MSRHVRDAIARPRPPARGPDSRQRQDRTRIAQAAARLIVEHGLTDWAAAKRKAARQLVLPESAAFPSNDEVEQALAEYQALYGGDAQRRSLDAQRRLALDWMRRLGDFAPVLVGGVAAGWAGAHQDIRLELVADDPKAVEMLLAGRDVCYRGLASHGDDRVAELVVDLPDAAIRLSIVTVNDRRHRPRSDAAARLDTEAVAQLVAAAAARG